ncbi:MAG: hypothetical protein NUW01_08880 [Gemmatimonadaceae bacterium]|nr:hypothetical protein [Gemmatimonadaceae bacterium]
MRGGFRPGRPKGAKNKPEGVGERDRRLLQDAAADVLTPEVVRAVLEAVLKRAEEPSGYKDRELALAYALGKPEVTSHVTISDELTAEEIRTLSQDARLHLVPEEPETDTG